MTMPLKPFLGTTALAALAVGALIAWQAASDSPEDLSQLSDAEKLDIINGEDGDAAAELLEAEEAAAQEKLARERLERGTALAAIEVERAEAHARGATYWDSFDPDSINLTGFDFDITKIALSQERRTKFTELPLVSGFERAREMNFPPSKFDCNPTRYADIGPFLKSNPTLPMPVDRDDVARVLDYLGDRVALETGDCSCAAKAVPVEEGWRLLERLTSHPSGDEIRGNSAKGRAIDTTTVLFRTVLEAEARSFCEKG